MPHGMTWFSFLPGYEQLAAYLRHEYARATVLGPTAFAVQHMLGALVVLIVLLLVGLAANRRLADIETNVVPDGKLSLLSGLELVIEALYGVMKDIIGPDAKRYFPLVGTLALYIFFCNALGLIPGFEPPTNNVSTNAGCALFVFFYYNYQGIRVNGVGYIVHMANPVGTWWGWFLAPLMFPVELIGHLARPLSLTLRLFGNMVGDHAVVLGFAGMIPLLVPIPFQALGLLVCVIQAFVFALLTTTYISMATAAAHEEEEPAH